MSADTVGAVRILGVDVADLDRETAIAVLRHAVAEDRHLKLAFFNAHCGNVAATDARYSQVLHEFLVLADGIGADLAARLLHGAPFQANLNGTDFVPHFLGEVPEPLTVGLLGARPGIGDKAASRLAASYPRHRFVHIDDGYFSADEELALLQRIARLRPDILLVGLGVPRQEKWIHAHIGKEHCTIAMGVGALIDFVSGTLPRAPGWMRQARLEWLYRLLLEPGRMWRRYILGNPLFLLRVLRQKRKRKGQK